MITAAPVVEPLKSISKHASRKFESYCQDYYMSLYLNRKKEKFLVYINSKNEKISFSSKKWKNIFPYVKNYIQENAMYYMGIFAKLGAIKVKVIKCQNLPDC